MRSKRSNFIFLLHLSPNPILPLFKKLPCILLLFMLLFTLPLLAQKKKEIKKLHIKSIKSTINKVVNGKEITLNDSYERYNKNGNKIEEIIYDNNGLFIKKRATEYNADDEPVLETEFDSKGNVTEKTVINYNANGEKTSETVSDGNGKLHHKSIYVYDKNGLKTERKSNNATGGFISVKKFIYEY